METLNNYDYMSIAYDLSGSMAKNRFRNEILWGLLKILELHEKQEEYTVVFDYVTDIEVHLNTSNEFYQVKTKKSGKYSYKTLIKKQKNEQYSILSQLYALRSNKDNTDNNNFLITVVSNLPLLCKNKTYDNVEYVDFASLDDEIKKEIQKIIEVQLAKKISLKNVKFIRSFIPLYDPVPYLKGKLADFYLNYYGEEPSKISALYNSIESQIQDKSNYEMNPSSYNDILVHKGISKKDFESSIKRYREKTNTYVQEAKEFINKNHENALEKFKKNKALSSIVIDLEKSISLRNQKESIKQIILDDQSILNDTEINVVKGILKKVSKKNIENTELELEALVILALQEINGGDYE